MHLREQRRNAQQIIIMNFPIPIVILLFAWRDCACTGYQMPKRPNLVEIRASDGRSTLTHRRIAEFAAAASPVQHRADLSSWVLLCLMANPLRQRRMAASSRHFDACAAERLSIGPRLWSNTLEYSLDAFALAQSDFSFQGKLHGALLENTL